ncbi:hypothetical protein ACLOJK_029858 [Asimina triloba]
MSSSSASSFFLGSHHLPLPLPRSSSRSRITSTRTTVASSRAENHGHEPRHLQKGRTNTIPMAISAAAAATRRESLTMTLLASLSLGIVYALPVPPTSMWAWGVAAAEESPCSLTVAPSGLAFCDRLLGSGPEPSKGQLIKAHYVGKLENGKVFDSSYQRGKPLTFRVGVGEVIKGWDQGILGGDGVPPMLAGGKRTLKLPPELGYGTRGVGCKGGNFSFSSPQMNILASLCSCIIPPSSVLLFDVEFVGKA